MAKKARKGAEDQLPSEQRLAADAMKAIAELMAKHCDLGTDEVCEVVYETADEFRTGVVRDFRGLPLHGRTALMADLTAKSIRDLDRNHPDRLKASLALLGMQAITFGVRIEPEVDLDLG